MPCLETDPDGAGEPPRVLDAEITAAAKSLFFARDLVRPGPGLLPFGAKARARQERRREVDSIAATRRAELAELLSARRNTRSEPDQSAGHRGRPRVVAALLTTVVIAVAAAGWWISQTSTAPSPPQTVAETGSELTDLRRFDPDLTTSVITRPGAQGSEKPAVDLTSPETAAARWLAAWCPIYHRSPIEVAARVRSVMTDAGWAQFTATPGQTAPSHEPGAAASCDTPRARIVSRPPGSTNTVLVLVSATRTVTDTTKHTAIRRFRIERRQYVLLGVDGSWRVDVAAVGG
ncbi:hypothetical protein ACVBEQ_05475 [Nakamurella sp. GG22]